MKKFSISLLLILVILSQAISQDNSKFEGDLIQYLTAVQLTAEGHALMNYCGCKKEPAFTFAYQNLRIAYNGFISSYQTKLTMMKVSHALDDFKSKNWESWVNQSSEMTAIYKELAKFTYTSCESSKESALPSAISVAEITGVASAIIGLINKAKDRKDAQRTNLLKILESLKMPSLSEYKCPASK